MTLDIKKLDRVVADIEACPRNKDILDSCARNTVLSSRI